MKGKLIGVGVGPGDPKLLTVKAIEAIKGADYVAYPTSGIQANGERSSNVALRIIREHIEGKELLEYLMPMSRDKEYVQRCPVTVIIPMVDAMLFALIRDLF